MFLKKDINRINLKHVIFSARTMIDNSARLSGIELKFFAKNSDEIYTKSYKNNFEVAYSFNHLFLRLSTKELLFFASTLVEGLSSYLYNIRYKVVGEQHLETKIKLNPDNHKGTKYHLRITNNRKKHRRESRNAKDKMSYRYKVMVAIDIETESGDKIEVVELRFSKRDVQLMLNLIKSVFVDEARIFNFALANNQFNDDDKDIYQSKNVISVSKIDNAIAFDDFFIHGQEMLNLAYVVERLIFDNHIESFLETLYSNYRQVSIFPYNDFMVGLKIKKMSVSENPMTKLYDHTVDEEAGEKEILFNNRMLAGLFLFTTPSQMRHSSLGGKTAQGSFEKKVMYHINMKESNLAIGFNSKPKVKVSRQTEKEYMNFFSISVSSKESLYEEGKSGFIKHFEYGASEPTYIPAITSVSLGLFGMWGTFLETITKANNSEFVEGETVLRKRLHIMKQEPDGKYRYVLGLYSDAENEAPLVFSIEKYKKDEPDEILAKFRQPMFHKYIYQFLMIAMQSAFELKNFSFTEEKDLADILGVQYTGIDLVEQDNKLEPPLSAIMPGTPTKIGISKVENSIVKIGNLKKKNESFELSYSDIAALNTSCENRILHGSWIPFVGEKISVSQDGFLTDLRSEVNLEGRGMGAFYAWQYFFGTSIR